MKIVTADFVREQNIKRYKERLAHAYLDTALDEVERDTVRMLFDEESLRGKTAPPIE